MANEFGTEDEGLGEFEQWKQDARSRYARYSLLELIGDMDVFKKKKERLELEEKQVNAIYDVLRLELVPSKMEEEGIEKIAVTGIGRVSLTGDVYVHPVASARAKFFDWLRANKVGDLIKEQVAPSTLKAFVKKRLETGAPVPEDFVKVTPFTRASITKA